MWEEDEDHPDAVFAVISLCRPFFDNYKDWSGPVHMGLFGPTSIDQGVAVNTCNLSCYSSFLTFLHGQYACKPEMSDIAD